MVHQNDGGIAAIVGSGESSGQHGRTGDPDFVRPLRAPDTICLAGYDSFETAPGDGLCLGGRRNIHVPVRGGGDDDVGERMLRAALQRRAYRKRLALGDPVDIDGGQRKLALGQGAGLVEGNDGDVTPPLERVPVPHQHTIVGGHGSGVVGDQRNGETQRVRTGDDQHRDGAGNGEVRGTAEAKPDEQRWHGHTDGDDRQPESRSVAEFLIPAPRGLGVGHKPHDL